jgi:very-short-patch-repair endonuclease
LSALGALYLAAINILTAALGVAALLSYLFSHLDLNLARVRPGSGVELLRNYLQYASTNSKRLGDAEVTGEPPNAFETEVFDCLSAKGLRLISQTGASRFPIDMVAEHPTKPGRYVLAIECDGATYHSSYTARDRDRLRQQQLEGLGWWFHRIWSTDWFMRKEDEIERAAFSESVEFADKLITADLPHGLKRGIPTLPSEPGRPIVLFLEPLVFGGNCDRFAGSKCPIKIKSNAAIAQKWGC